MTFGLCVAALVLAVVALVQSKGTNVVAWAVLLIGIALTYRF
jgi:hypothetical protein